MTPLDAPNSQPREVASTAQHNNDQFMSQHPERGLSAAINSDIIRQAVQQELRPLLHHLQQVNVENQNMKTENQKMKAELAKLQQQIIALQRPPIGSNQYETQRVYNHMEKEYSGEVQSLKLECSRKHYESELARKRDRRIIEKKAFAHADLVEKIRTENAIQKPAKAMSPQVERPQTLEVILEPNGHFEHASALSYKNTLEEHLGSGSVRVAITTKKENQRLVLNPTKLEKDYLEKLKKFGTVLDNNPWHKLVIDGVPTVEYVDYEQMSPAVDYAILAEEIEKSNEVTLAALPRMLNPSSLEDTHKKGMSMVIAFANRNDYLKVKNKLYLVDKIIRPRPFRPGTPIITDEQRQADLERREAARAKRAEARGEWYLEPSVNAQGSLEPSRQTPIGGDLNNAGRY